MSVRTSKRARWYKALRLFAGGAATRRIERKPRKPAQTVRHAAAHCFQCPTCAAPVTLDEVPSEHRPGQTGPDAPVFAATFRGTCRCCKRKALWNVQYRDDTPEEPTDATPNPGTEAKPSGDAAEASP